MKSILLSTLAGAFALAAATAQEIGKAAPAFSVKNTKGEVVSLADLKGKTVVLEWFNLSCPFVVKHYEFKNMQTLQADYTAKGVVWLSVNSSAETKGGYCSPEKMTECIKTQGMKSTHVLIDSTGTMGHAYGAKTTPHLFVINKEGALAYDGAIDSKPSTDKADVAGAEKTFAIALDAVLAGADVPNAKNKPYGCSVKY